MWLPAHGIQEVGRQRHVQHLLDKDAAHNFGRIWVAFGVQRIQRTQIGRHGKVLEFNRPLQMLS